jgi:hypothetical protein
MNLPGLIASIFFVLTIPSAFTQMAATCPVSSGPASSNINGEFKTTFSVNIVSPAVYTALPGRPFSAEEISQQKQILADGSSITHSSPAAFYYRDSSGRVRTERPLTVLGQVKASEMPAIPEIFDPVSGYCYFLDAINRLTYRIAIPKPIKMLSPSKTSTPIIAPRVRVSADKTSNVSEYLGIKDADGLDIIGTRNITTYPAGLMGNDKPITSTSESWVSPDLNVTVIFRTLDPRIGENIRTLINVSREEPDPGLFQAPRGYKVVDPTEPFTITAVSNMKQ